jgi:tyrosyl-tRNA synthetase
LDLEQRIDLIMRNAEEVITAQEICTLLETTTKPRAYWGFECSGQ